MGIFFDDDIFWFHKPPCFLTEEAFRRSQHLKNAYQAPYDTKNYNRRSGTVRFQVGLCKNLREKSDTSILNCFMKKSEEDHKYFEKKTPQIGAQYKTRREMSFKCNVKLLGDRAPVTNFEKFEL